MKSNHSLIRILLFALFILVLLCCLCFAQNKNRIKKIRRFEESEIYDDIVRAEDDEFVDDIPVDENEFKDDDQDVEYENCIEYRGGHKETYTPHRGDKSSSGGASSSATKPTADSKEPDASSQSQQSQLSFNPYSYYKSLLDNDLNYVKFYGDKVNTHGTDSQYSQIAKKYANNLANHAKYLYKYRTFAPTTYRKYILQVYEYSKRVVEVAKVQNWNGYMYYLSITIEYYRKIDVLEQTGYAGTNYVQTTPVATYYGAAGTPTAYYSNGAPPAGAVTATAVAPVNPSYYPAANYGGYGGYGGYPANYYPYNGYGAYGGYLASTGGYYPAAANYGYNAYPASYYPAQYSQPVQQAVIAKGANLNNQQPAQASSSSQASSNSTSASAGSSSTSTSSPSSNANSNSTGGSSSSGSPSPQKKKLNPIEQLEKLNSQVSSHVGEFNDDASNPSTEPFTFEYLM